MCLWLFCHFDLPFNHYMCYWFLPLRTTLETTVLIHILLSYVLVVHIVHFVVYGCYPNKLNSIKWQLCICIWRITFWFGLYVIAPAWANQHLILCSESLFGSVLDKSQNIHTNTHQPGLVWFSIYNLEKSIKPSQMESALQAAPKEFIHIHLAGAYATQTERYNCSRLLRKQRQVSSPHEFQPAHSSSLSLTLKCSDWFSLYAINIQYVARIRGICNKNRSSMKTW
jgi:hypothetical protein